MKVYIPVSLGELLDKISILEIKNQKILNESKLRNINRELSGLRNVLEELNINLSETDDLYKNLYKINLTFGKLKIQLECLKKTKILASNLLN